MQLAYRIADAGKLVGTGLDEHEAFSARFDLALPAEDRFDMRHDVHAGGEMVFDEISGDLTRLFFRGGGGEDDSFVSHIESAVSPRVTAEKESSIFGKE